jgi:hypothetical protein
MADSRTLRRCLAALAAVVAVLGCVSSPPVAPPRSALEPLTGRAPMVPDEADHAARDLMAATLASDPEAADRAVARLEATDAEREAAGEPPTGLVPAALDARNSTTGDAAAYRTLTEQLLERDDLDPALRTRLAQSVDDDPLVQAGARMRDARVESYGGIFNALAEPASRAATSGYRAIAGVLRAVLGLALASHTADEISIPERQALAQWRRFLAEQPDAPAAAAVRTQVAESEEAWNRTQRDRLLRGARAALRHDQPASALVAAERALRIEPEDPEALALASEARARLERERQDTARSLAAPESLAAVDDADAARLERALLAPNGDVSGAAQRLLDREPEGPLADEARFSLALANGERGDEDAQWSGLAELADAGASDADGANMARHAEALAGDPDQNLYQGFLDARGRDVTDQVGWVVLGPLAKGPRERDLPRSVEWLVELPSYFDALTSIPNRLVRYPWLAPWPFGREPAAYARRYLTRQPNGSHAPELREWLVSFEESRGNYVGALEVASAGAPHPRPDVAAAPPGMSTASAATYASSIDLAELRSNAARQAFEAAEKERRRPLRLALLRRVARDFSDTEAGREAGLKVREEAERATPQRIRVSRGFLRENPHIAGPDGFGLRPELLDGDPRNGELHRDGVILAGGRVLEFCYVAESGDDDDLPRTVQQQVSDERLARVVSLLQQTAEENELLDPDDALGNDPARDAFFEHARLGIADQATPRPGTESSYAFLSMRERYGLVRGRESILPVDIVIKGSFPDISLDAFPRIRMPKATADSFLYR